MRNIKVPLMDKNENSEGESAREKKSVNSNTVQTAVKTLLNHRAVFQKISRAKFIFCQLILFDYFSFLSIIGILTFSINSKKSTVRRKLSV